MTNTGSLTVTTPTDRDIAMTRVFNAPRHLAECEIDLRVGGSLRYVWRNKVNGMMMGLSGVYREIVPNERIVSTEQFDDPWYEGEAVGTLTLVEENGKTTMTNTVRYASKEVRDNVLKSGMERGVAASYDKLEKDVLAA